MADEGPAPAEENVPFAAIDTRDDGKYHLLLACSGSVATIKISNIISELANHANLSIRLILTECAVRFLQGQTAEQPDLDALGKLANVDAIYRDADEWSPSWTRNAPILHIELRRWADSLWVVPLSANTLAKVAHGLCDNLLTSVLRAWQVLPPGTPMEAVRLQQRFIFMAPAMNTAMWKHPLTQQHLTSIEDFQKTEEQHPWISFLQPQNKELACGDVGAGAMRDWRLIVDDIRAHIEEQGPVRQLDT